MGSWNKRLDQMIIGILTLMVLSVILSAAHLVYNFVMELSVVAVGNFATAIILVLIVSYALGGLCEDVHSLTNKEDST